MDQNDWQYTATNTPHQHRQRMPDTPPHQNVRRYSQQPQQQPQQQQPPPNSGGYSPSTRQHSITSDFSGINIRDDNNTSHPGVSSADKSARPNLSLHPAGLRPSQPPLPQSQTSVPSSPTRQSGLYSASSHPGLGRTNSDEMRHYPPPQQTQPPSNSRHSSPMHTASPTMSPYYSTTPHMLNSINEREPTVSWSQGPAQARHSPSRSAYAFPPGRDSVSPRSHLHSQQSPSQHRHSMPHVPPNYDPKVQYSPRQATHFPGSAMASSPSISPTSFSPRGASFRDPGSMMGEIVYSNPPPAKFRIVTNITELIPTVNTQPKYRRANPDGGFISVLTLKPYRLTDSPCKR